MKRILIVIPALNEAQVILPVIEACMAYGDVLVIDDGSSDLTRDVAEKAGAWVISNPTNKGYEYTLGVGYAYAVKHAYDAMLTIDADGQLPTSRIPDFIAALHQGAYLVVGERNSLIRLSEKILAFFSARFGQINDPYCGMKAYTLMGQQFRYFSRYNSVGTALAFDYVDQGLRVENIAIEIKSRQGTSRFGGAIVSELRLSVSMFINLYRLLKHVKHKI